MTKERIATVGIIIIGIVLGRYLLKRMEIDAERANMQSRIM
jgi:Na+/glutamate symporter